jgi:hypothetical protein
MVRKHLVKLNDEEYDALLRAKEVIRQWGISTFSKVAQSTVKDNALGSYIHLGSQLIVEHLERVYKNPFRQT